MHIATDDETIQHDSNSSLWAGRLFLPTGQVILSDWSMQERGHVQVRPGNYAVTVGIEETGELVVKLARA